MDHNGKISCSQDQQTSCSVTKVDKEVFRERIVCQPSNTSVPQDLVGSESGPAASDASEVPGLKLAVVAETSNGSAVIAEVEEYPINLDDYNSAAELEVLGLEKLTTELTSTWIQMWRNFTSCVLQGFF